MKTIFRFLSLAVVLAGLGATAAFAQGGDACADVEGQTALYTKVTDNYAKKTVPEKKVAIESGKQFLEKYGACEALKDQVDFVKAQVPAQEAIVAKMEGAAKLQTMFDRF